VTGTRRIGVHGLHRDEAGRVLLVPERPGAWRLPGGLIRHGESPDSALARLVGGPVAGVREVVTEVGGGVHVDRIVYDVSPDPPPDARWFAPEEAAEAVLTSYTRMVVGVEGEVAAVAVVDGAGRLPAQDRQVQRFGAYGLVTDPAGRILLTLISPRYPGAGRWHLPGGGTDFGETATAGVLREIEEESGQRGRVTGLLGVSHRHNARELGPEGHAMDWHTVRAVYSVAVDEPTAPVVHDVGGSTAEAAWFAPGDLGRVRLTEMASTFVALSGTTARR